MWGEPHPHPPNDALMMLPLAQHVSPSFPANFSSRVLSKPIRRGVPKPSPIRSGC